MQPQRLVLSCVKRFFSKQLSEETLMVHGSFLLSKICVSILEHESFVVLVKEFIPFNSIGDSVGLICNYIMSIYTRMRSTGFAFMILRKGSKLKAMTRTTLAVISNPKNRSKKSKKNKFLNIRRRWTK